MSTVSAVLSHHPTISHYLRFVSTTIGRDKALRTIQYLARFLSWYLLRKGYAAESIAPWSAIKANFGVVRKAMRLGKNVEHLRAASASYEKASATSDPVLSYLSTCRQLGYFFYLTFDNLAFLDTTGIYRLPNAGKRVAKEAQRAWLMGITFSLVAGIYQLRKLSEEEKSVVKTEAEGRLASERITKERKVVKTQLISDAADFVIPATGLGILGFDEGIVGLAGLVSSVIGLQAAWKKTA